MSFRQKLLASYLVFVAALAAMGAWSVWRLEQAGAVSHRILSENLESVLAAQSMKESLERQDSGVLFGRLGEATRAEQQSGEYRRRFDEAFARAAGNITEPGEQEIIEAIRRTREAYYHAMDEKADYFGRLEPLFNELRHGLDRLLEVNQQAMLRKSADADRVTRRALAMTLVLALGLIATGAGLALALSARINRDADRLKSEFVGTASHELRTPLTTLQMGIALLNEQLTPTANPRQREILDMCQQDAARLERLVADLLDLSKMASGHMKPTLAPVKAAVLLREALAPSRPRIDGARLELRVDAPDNLPAVSADVSQIERVMANLISNAVRATPQGGRITVTAREVPNLVQVSVSDTGRGIPREYLSRLFHEFVQVPGASTGNAGLGLAISQRIVKAHGGDMIVESEPGRGATFTFTLPVASGVAAPAGDVRT